MSNTATETARQKLIVQDDSAVANLMDTGRFEHMFRIAGAMSAASLIPEHLLGTKKGGSFTAYTAEQVKANCFLIVNQSLRWGLDPFAVMPETYVVGGKLAYQGKLIAAVVNARADLDGRLAYTFTGKIGADDLTVTVSGKFRGSPKPSEVTLSVGQAKTDNQMWRKDPEQKLIYSGVVKWARRYCPEIVLGIISDDDADAIEMRDATPRPATVAGNPWKDGKDGKPSAIEASPAEVIDGKAEVAFDRTGKLKELAAAVKTSGRKNAEALTIFRDAGMIGAEAKAISDATDEQIVGMLAATHLLEKTAEEPAPEPIETPTPTEAWLDRIEELGLEQEPALKLHQIEAICRKAKVLSTTETLKGCAVKRLEGFHANFAAILEKAGKEEA